MSVSPWTLYNELERFTIDATGSTSTTSTIMSTGVYLPMGYVMDISPDGETIAYIADPVGETGRRLVTFHMPTSTLTIYSGFYFDAQTASEPAI